MVRNVSFADGGFELAPSVLPTGNSMVRNSRHCLSAQLSYPADVRPCQQRKCQSFHANVCRQKCRARHNSYKNDVSVWYNDQSCSTRPKTMAEHFGTGQGHVWYEPHGVNSRMIACRRSVIHCRKSQLHDHNRSGRTIVALVLCDGWVGRTARQSIAQSVVRSNRGRLAWSQYVAGFNPCQVVD